MPKTYLTIICFFVNGFLFSQDTLTKDSTHTRETKRLTEQESKPKIDLDSIASLSRQIELNTQPSYFNERNWDEWVILILSLIAAVGTFLTWQGTQLTAKSVEEENRKKLIKSDIQEKILIDLIRHFFRNKIVLCAMELKLRKEGFGKFYPSEEHLLKLKVLPEDQRFDRFDNIPQHYNELHKLELMFRNFNIEADVCLVHLMDPKMPEATKLKDLDTLEFKMEFLTRKILDLMKSLGFDHSTKRIKEFLLKESNSYKDDKSEKERANIEVPPRREERRYYDDELGLTEIVDNDIKIEYPIIKLIGFH
ncbi:hypothetical protein [Ekhidna sp.]|uniref:hypothetical protein n=1 Tax=Ekhidna sp. TaxID=2608089 RepID=UPI003CCBF5A3